jgi:hypothetical protein
MSREIIVKVSSLLAFLVELFNCNDHVMSRRGKKTRHACFAIQFIIFNLQVRRAVLAENRHVDVTVLISIFPELTSQSTSWESQ